MKILYDHQAFSLEKYGGIPKYFCELMKNIPSEHQINLSVLLTHNQYLKEDYDLFKKLIYKWPELDFTGKNFIKKKIDFLNRQNSIRALSSNKYDLFHPTFYNDYFLDHLKKPYIITVHDLIIFKFKDTIYNYTHRRQMEEKVIRKANRIISISLNTKKDLIDIFNISPEKIDIVHHGFNQPDIKTNLNNYGKYILFVGRRDNYKNFKNFVEAASSLMKKESDLKLICIGSPFEKEEKDYLNILDILEKTITLRVNEKTLNILYSNALVFVYPSLYEGFGMPILEAFANNCPVCLSNTSCFPEIAGDAASYFDPKDPESIQEAIKKVLYNNSYKEQLINAGKRRLLNFSWTKTGEQTIASYEMAIS